MISQHHPLLLLLPLLFFSPFHIHLFVFLLSPNSFHTVSLFSHVISRSFLHSLPFHFSASALSCPANFQPPPSRFFWPLHFGVVSILSLPRIVTPTINRISSIFFFFFYPRESLQLSGPPCFGIYTLHPWCQLDSITSQATLLFIAITFLDLDA